MLQKLPKGKQEFSRIREEDCAYVDKTGLLYKLISDEGFCFLSRPRRFGKSLLVSTLAELFRGKRDLFGGLAIAALDYDWTPHPVLALNFSGLSCRSPEMLESELNAHFTSQAQQMGIDLQSEAQPGATLVKLVRMLRQLGKVVLLVDEYDAPLLKNLDDSELIRANRQVLHDVFATIKKLEIDLRFVFITGVSRFSKVSLFSGLNNLTDISFSPEYATLTGFTEDEIRSVFAEHLQAIVRDKQWLLEQIVEQLRYWYNGYRFAYRGATPGVYNPWSVIQFLASQEIDNYWFASGTPTFAIEKIKERSWTLPDLQSEVIASSDLKNSWDSGRIELVPLLYQSGYLTIDREDELNKSFSLCIPNEEVRQSLVAHLLVSYSGKESSEFEKLRQKLRSSLVNNELALFFETFNVLLAAISYRLHIPQERFYHALLQMCLLNLGFAVATEVETNRGRIDIVAELPNRIFIFELKIDHSAKGALKQIKETQYAEKYQHHGKPIELVGIRCSSKSRSVTDWVQETLATKLY